MTEHSADHTLPEGYVCVGTAKALLPGHSHHGCGSLLPAAAQLALLQFSCWPAARPAGVPALAVLPHLP